MKKEGRSVYVIATFALAAVLALLLSGLPAVAQDKPADNMQVLRDKLRADKKLVVAEAMQLTDSEAKAFWPVYENYQKELSKLGTRTINMITEYAKNYQSMNNETAKKLTDEFLAIQAGQQKLRTAYLPQFRKVLTDVKVARFYQVENKIHAAVNYELAANIPLMK
jgi:hypothetical protein